MAETEKKLFKQWFDQEAAEQLASQIGSAYPGFKREKFLKLAVPGLEELEMNARVARFSEAMAACLPRDREKALKILMKSLPPTTADETPVTNGWLQWPLGQFIADYGIPHFETAMEVMTALTRRFTSEFAVRPFLEAYPRETLICLSALTDHESPHVRRWCSEGTRPLLPWGKKIRFLVEDPSPVWPILEALKDDPSPYVRKSVANHLNDISKNHPDQVIERCALWLKEADSNRTRLIRHGLRTLIKAGDPKALALLGYRSPENLSARLSLSESRLSVGQSLVLTLHLHNQSPDPQKLLIDYAVEYVRQRGKTGRKVFKWTTVDLSAGGRLDLRKSHAMKLTSVRALYPGKHCVEAMVNGVCLGRSSFMLTQEPEGGSQ